MIAPDGRQPVRAFKPQYFKAGQGVVFVECTAVRHDKSHGHVKREMKHFGWTHRRSVAAVQRNYLIVPFHIEDNRLSDGYFWPGSSSLVRGVTAGRSWLRRLGVVL
jgi:hypothetical protein